MSHLLVTAVLVSIFRRHHSDEVYQFFHPFMVEAMQNKVN